MWITPLYLALGEIKTALIPKIHRAGTETETETEAETETETETEASPRMSLAEAAGRKSPKTTRNPAISSDRAPIRASMGANRCRIRRRATICTQTWRQTCSRFGDGS